MITDVSSRYSERFVLSSFSAPYPTGITLLGCIHAQDTIWQDSWGLAAMHLFISLCVLHSQLVNTSLSYSNSACPHEAYQVCDASV